MIQICKASFAVLETQRKVQGRPGKEAVAEAN